MIELKENDLVFSKVKPNAIIPNKRDEDAGYDIYACFDEMYMEIKAHQTVLIPTGVASALHYSKYLQAEERGSTGGKGIKKSAGVVDSGYRNEIFIAITNTNNKDLIISKAYTDTCVTGKSIVYPYTKAIAQLVVHEVPAMNVQEVTYDELKSIKSERGLGLLGSSNK